MKEAARPHCLGLVSEPQTEIPEGSAKRKVESDQAVWPESCPVEAENLLEAQCVLKKDQARVEWFLRAGVNTNHSVALISLEKVRSSERQGGHAVRPGTAGDSLRPAVYETRSRLKTVAAVAFADFAPQ